MALVIRGRLNQQESAKTKNNSQLLLAHRPMFTIMY